MRMWKVNPKCLCTKHLLGEHVEMHMFVGTINKGIRIDGYLNNKLVEVDLIHSRHDELAKEMSERGMDHKSPLPNIKEYKGLNGVVDIEDNIKNLMTRCDECKQRFEEHL